MSTSIKKNFLYSSFLTVANYLFPLLTFPYVTRVLEVDNIGVCGYVDSIVNYFSLFSLLGINTVGVRAIASSKGDREAMSRAFSSLFWFNTATTALAAIILVVTAYTVEKFQPYQDFLLVGIVKLVSIYFMVEWFYRGTENFKYITVRTLVIKCLYVASIFIFVKKRDDVLIYYWLTVLSIAVNAIFNFCYARNFVSLTFKNLEIKPHLRPLFYFGFYFFITSMYTSFNVTYLGWHSSDEEVGYYTTAFKLYTILISIFTAFTGVMMPRMTNLLSQGKFDEFVQYISKSQNMLLAFAIPVILFAAIFAPQIIEIVAGPGFEKAVTPMRIIIPLILIIGFEQVLVTQTLNPLKKDTIILMNSFFGAIVGLTSNYFLVPILLSSGSAVAWLLSETAVLLSSQYFVTKFINLKFPFKSMFLMALYNVPLLLLFILGSRYINYNCWVTVIIMGSVMVIYSVLLQCKLKNPVVLSFVNKFLKKA
ncbi:MAG: flippase [Paludibacteraceae bacterium]|nr:flippase [Paludibacteraceae bacterium]